MHSLDELFGCHGVHGLEMDLSISDIVRVCYGKHGNDWYELPMVIGTGRPVLQMRLRSGP